MVKRLSPKQLHNWEMTVNFMGKAYESATPVVEHIKEEYGIDVSVEDVVLRSETVWGKVKKIDGKPYLRTEEYWDADAYPGHPGVYWYSDGANRYFFDIDGKQFLTIGVDRGGN